MSSATGSRSPASRYSITSPAAADDAPTTRKSLPNRRPRSSSSARTTPALSSTTNSTGRDICRRLGAGLAGGLDVLVDVERVVRVVPVLDLGEPVVVAAVGRLDPVLALVHQEVDVAAAGRGRVQLLPVVPGPLRDEGGVGGIGIDAHDDTGPAAVPVGEGRRGLGHAARGAVDGVQVHGRVTGRQP